MREAAYLTVALMKSCKSIFNVGKKKVLTSVNISVFLKVYWFFFENSELIKGSGSSLVLEQFRRDKWWHNCW